MLAIRWGSFVAILVAVGAVALSTASARSDISNRVYRDAQDGLGARAALIDQIGRIAHSADVSGTITPGGPPQTVTISTAGDKARVSFDGVASARVSLNLTNVSIALSYVSIQKPAGAGNLVSPTPVFSSGKFIDVVTLPTTGVYTIYIDPQSNGIGSMTLTLYDVPPDTSGTMVAGGSAVVAATTVPGQNARYTFSGTQGQRVSLAISGVSLAPSGSFEVVSLLSPSGANLGGSGVTTTTGWIDTKTLPASGVYTILVDPGGAATGSSTLTLYDVPPDVSGTLTPSQTGDALSPSTSTPGQNAKLTFAGSQGQRVSLKISDIALSGGGTFEAVSILKPDGSSLASAGVLTSSGWIDTQTLPFTGTYTVFVDPDRGATASTTLRAYDVPPDFAGLIDPESDNAVNETTTVPGQDARLTFAGTAGDTVYVPRGGVTIPLSWVKVLKPDGSQLVGTPLSGAGDGSLTATLPTTGTYTVLVDGYQDAVGNMTLAVTDEDALVGELSADQSPADVVEADPSPAAPQPATPSGLLPRGSYATEVWDSSEVGNDRGLEVVSSTAGGTFATTGIVKDETLEIPIAGAAVTVTVGATSVTTTTDANGAWAVANMPSGSTDLTITAPPSYGSYQLTNSLSAADETYEQTVGLSPTALAEDGSPDTVDLTEQDQAVIQPPGTAFSQSRVPPTMRVRMLNLYPVGSPNRKNCAALPGEPAKDDFSVYRPVKPYAFDYYVERVAYQELNSFGLNQVGMTANLALIQNYGWFHKTLGGQYDVDNSARFQCFRERRQVGSHYRRWVKDVLDKRVTTAQNKLRETRYFGNSVRDCSDPAFPQHGDIAGQLVLAGRSENDCPRETNWRDLVLYYYVVGTKVMPGKKPLPPSTSAVHWGSNELRINFSSTVYAKNVAWKFRVFQRQSDGSWNQFPEVKLTGSGVPSYLQLTAAQAAGTHRYRVQAWNPVAWSQISNVRGPNGSLDITG